MKRILVLIAILLGACNPPENPDAPSLRAAVEAHLAAVSALDMQALLPTLTGKDSLVLFTAGGGQFETRQQYLDFQRDWFASHAGDTIEVEILDITESLAFGHALVEYRYSPQNAADETQIQQSWSILTFDLENGSWLLSMRSDTFDDPRKQKHEKLY